MKRKAREEIERTPLHKGDEAEIEEKSREIRFIRRMKRKARKEIERPRFIRGMKLK
jgi:hypothetical protein